MRIEFNFHVCLTEEMAALRALLHFPEFVFHFSIFFCVQGKRQHRFLTTEISEIFYQN